jgi:hypothetical protein
VTQDEIIASNLSEVEKANERIKMLEDKLASIKQAIAELESQEPVAWQLLGSAHFRKKLPKNADITAWNPVYHQPPQRTWVGLTDEEICMFSMWLDSKPDATVFTAIEARLKEKNT